jgi:FtsP/CotA-like multicopper oxidase with cupredoxin domain
MAPNDDHATATVADCSHENPELPAPQARAPDRRTGALVGPVPRLDPRPHDLRALGRWLDVTPTTWAGRIASPLGALTIAALLFVRIAGYGLGAAARSGSSGTPAPSASSTSGMGMGGGAPTSTPANVPEATQQYGDQPATFTTDSDGAKHFTFTAEQVMWSPLKGARVLAWTLGGTVPGPQIRVTAGDHLRITVINRLPKATALHWHGLEVPSDQDGVPGVGMRPIQPGQTYTYDFGVGDQDVGTHWYHSHYDDLEQVGGGLYGAFIVDPRPGSAQAQQAIPADVTE